MRDALVRFGWFLLLAAAVMALLSAPARAQDFRGSILGIVSDSQGGVLPGLYYTVLWNPILDPRQANFGLVNADRNNPRDIQLGVRLSF